jgi:hypothetical protein
MTIKRIANGPFFFEKAAHLRVRVVREGQAIPGAPAVPKI